MQYFVASYDLEETKPDPHQAFLEKASELGWSTWILSKKNIWFKLPNTTLGQKFSSREDAVKSFKNIWTETETQGFTVNVEKWIVIQSAGSTFDSDEKTPA